MGCRQIGDKRWNNGEYNGQNCPDMGSVAHSRIRPNMILGWRLVSRAADGGLQQL